MYAIESIVFVTSSPRNMVYNVPVLTYRPGPSLLCHLISPNLCLDGLVRIGESPPLLDASVFEC